jgi:hypothetical protein
VPGRSLNPMLSSIFLVSWSMMMMSCSMADFCEDKIKNTEISGDDIALVTCRASSKTQGTYLGHEVKTTLTLLLLKLEGDAADGATSDSLHKVGHETSDFISHSLGGDDGHLAHKLLVYMEVKGQPRVILLDKDSSGLLDGFSTDTLEKLNKKYM